MLGFYRVYWDAQFYIEPPNLAWFGLLNHLILSLAAWSVIVIVWFIVASTIWFVCGSILLLNLYQSTIT